MWLTVFCGTFPFPAMQRCTDELVKWSATAMTSCVGAATERFAIESKTLANRTSCWTLAVALESGSNQRESYYSSDEKRTSEALGGRVTLEARAIRF